MLAINWDFCHSNLALQLVILPHRVNGKRGFRYSLMEPRRRGKGPQHIRLLTLV
jgi:hypothetical protein